MYFKRIRDLREDHDLTQDEVARRIHCSRVAYQRYESGSRTIPLDCLIILCKLYNVSSDYLLESNEPLN